MGVRKETLERSECEYVDVDYCEGFLESAQSILQLLRQDELQE
jgi:hypothetical protein